MLQVLVFQWFVLTFRLAYFKVMLKTRGHGVSSHYETDIFNHLNTELNPICHLLALLEAHHILHVSRIRVNYLLITLIQKDVCDETVE